MKLVDRTDVKRGKTFESKKHPHYAIAFLLLFAVGMFFVFQHIHPYWVIVTANLVLMYISVLFLLIYFFENDEVRVIDDTFPSISVIIPCYNAGDTIGKCVEHVLNSNYPKPMEIIIVDDGSNDADTKKALKHLEKKVKVIYKPSNAGKAAALNTGIKECKGELVACLDSDSYVEKDALINMVKTMLKDEKNCAVTAFIKVHKPNSILTWIQEIEYYCAFGFNMLSYARLNSVFVTPGPMTLFRKKVFDEIGGFDENNPTEDLEICWRIRKYGYKISYSKDAIVYTEVPTKIKPLLKQRERWYRGKLFNIRLHRDMMFNPKYSLFGMFVLPTSLFAEVCALSLISSLVYTFGSTLFRNLQTIIGLINTGLSHKIIGYIITGTGPTAALAMTMVLLIPFGFVCMASYSMGIKKLRWNHITLIPVFLFLYGVFISFAYFISLVKELYGSAYRW